MKITLISPSMFRTPAVKPLWLLPSLTLATLAGMTPPDIEVQAIDERVEEIDYAEPRDLVGLTVHTFSARRAYQIAAEFRKRGVPVVLGGYHPTLAPEEAAQHADAVVSGEAEGVWEELLRDAAASRLKPFYRQAQPPPLVNIRPNRAIFAPGKYLPVGVVETSRGCPHACSFCAVTAFHQRRFRRRPPAEVAAEVAGLKEKFVFLIDDNITADPAGAKELFRALIPLKIKWVGQISVQTARDPELLRLMRASGCVGALIGFETLYPENLNQINKGWNLLAEHYETALKAFRAHGLMIVGSFFLGADGDTPAVLDSVTEFAIRQRLFAVLFNPCMPYPGTPLYDDLLGQGRMLRPQWWLDPAYTYASAVIHPGRMPAAELEASHRRIFHRFYGPASLLRRTLGLNLDPTNLFLYGMVNTLGARDEAQCFGHPLGEQP